MRQHLIAIIVAAAVSSGTAHALPAFGATSHRLGGSASQPEEHEAKTMSVLESLFAIFGFSVSANVEPVAREDYSVAKSKSRECDEARKAEVAAAERKEGSEGAAAKPRTPTGEPVYLAF